MKKLAKQIEEHRESVPYRLHGKFDRFGNPMTVCILVIRRGRKYRAGFNDRIALGVYTTRDAAIQAGQALAEQMLNPAPHLATPAEVGAAMKRFRSLTARPLTAQAGEEK